MKYRLGGTFSHNNSWIKLDIELDENDLKMYAYEQDIEWDLLTIRERVTLANALISLVHQEQLHLRGVSKEETQSVVVASSKVIHEFRDKQTAE